MLVANGYVNYCMPEPCERVAAILTNVRYAAAADASGPINGKIALAATLTNNAIGIADFVLCHFAYSISDASRSFYGPACVAIVTLLDTFQNIHCVTFAGLASGQFELAKIGQFHPCRASHDNAEALQDALRVKRNLPAFRGCDYAPDCFDFLAVLFRQVFSWEDGNMLQGEFNVDPILRLFAGLHQD
jgi:hypothetical protein